MVSNLMQAKILFASCHLIGKEHFKLTTWAIPSFKVTSAEGLQTIQSISIRGLAS